MDYQEIKHQKLKQIVEGLKKGKNIDVNLHGRICYVDIRVNRPYWTPMFGKGMAHSGIYIPMGNTMNVGYDGKMLWVHGLSGATFNLEINPQTTALENTVLEIDKQDHYKNRNRFYFQLPKDAGILSESLVHIAAED